MPVTIPAQGQGDTKPVVATDDIAGQAHQLIKVEFGPLGTATLASTANPLPTREPGPSTAVISAIAGSTSTGSQALLAANQARRAATIYNDVPSSLLFLSLGAAASTGAYSVQLPTGTFYELPLPVFRGALNGLVLTTSTGGAIMATELTD